MVMMAALKQTDRALELRRKYQEQSRNKKGLWGWVEGWIHCGCRW